MVQRGAPMADNPTLWLPLASKRLYGACTKPGLPACSFGADDAEDHRSHTYGGAEAAAHSIDHQGRRTSRLRAGRHPISRLLVPASSAARPQSLEWQKMGSRSSRTGRCANDDRLGGPRRRTGGQGGQPAGSSPHRERLASAASSVAWRSGVPQTAGEAASLYAQALEARAHLSDAAKRKTIHYVNKALRLIGAGDAIALTAIDTRAVRLMVDAVDSSAFERHHVFGAFDRFMTWCAKRELIPVNPCSGIDRDDRPRPGRSRDHTPPIATIQRAWDAVEDAPDHIRALIRFLLLVPLRRAEAQGLLWQEISLEEKRISIRAERMKGRQAHSLPLSESALAILAERASGRTANDRVFAPPSGARTINWDYWVTQIRVTLGEDDLERSRRFNLHDLRRSLVSVLGERGFDVDLLDQLLDHSRKGVFGVYQRSQRWREREAAMSAWGRTRCSFRRPQQCGGLPWPMISRPRGAGWQPERSRRPRRPARICPRVLARNSDPPPRVRLGRVQGQRE